MDCIVFFACGARHGDRLRHDVHRGQFHRLQCVSAGLRRHAVSEGFADGDGIFREFRAVRRLVGFVGAQEQPVLGRAYGLGACIVLLVRDGDDHFRRGPVSAGLGKARAQLGLPPRGFARGTACARKAVGGARVALGIRAGPRLALLSEAVFTHVVVCAALRAPVEPRAVVHGRGRDGADGRARGRVERIVGHNEAGEVKLLPRRGAGAPRQQQQ